MACINNNGYPSGFAVFGYSFRLSVCLAGGRAVVGLGLVLWIKYVTLRAVRNR